MAFLFEQFLKANHAKMSWSNLWMKAITGGKRPSISRLGLSIS